MINWNDHSLQRPAPPGGMRASRRRHTVATLAPPSRLDSSSEDEYGYERGLAYDHPPLPPSPVAVDPMSPERRARKQRIRPGGSASRRGGACHSDLLKSAVLATLESYESEEEFHTTASSNHSVVTPSDVAMSLCMDDNSRSSRKRARQIDMDEDCKPESSVLDDCLLGAMDVCTISTRQQPQSQTTTNATTPVVVPVRHVARRTSKELACGIVPSPRTNGIVAWPTNQFNSMRHRNTTTQEEEVE